MTNKRADDAPVIQALGRVPLFAGLSKKTIQQIASMCHQHTFDSGEQIVTQGDTSGRFYMIINGSAEVRVNGHLVNMLGAGQHFGEYAVIDREPRRASVIATTEVRAFSLASMTLRPLLKEQPEITYRLLLNACGHLRATQTSIA